MTSHFMLRLFAHEQFDFLDDQIQITHDGDSFLVHYRSAFRARPHSVGEITSHWEKRTPDGLRAVERCLRYLKWIVEERSSTSRPAVQ